MRQMDVAEEGSVDSKRWFFIWLSSFGFAGLILFFYFGVPLLPILASGVITFIATLIKFRTK